MSLYYSILSRAPFCTDGRRLLSAASPSSSAPSATSSQMFFASSPAVFIKLFNHFALCSSEMRVDSNSKSRYQPLCSSSVIVQIFKFHPTGVSLLVVSSFYNQYGCNATDVISMYRRPLPTTNLPFLSAVMFDGRESSPATGTTKILYGDYPAPYDRSGAPVRRRHHYSRAR